MKVLFLEGFYGGSHKAFADGFAARSVHDVHLETLPGRHWKWRQSGSALFFAEKLPEGSTWDAMVTTGMGDLAHLKALRPDLPPSILYLHENQLAYPVSDTVERDIRYGFTDLASMLSADSVVFNSRWNRESFFNELSSVFRRLPDAIPASSEETIRAKSRIIYPGVDSVSILETGRSRSDASRDSGKDSKITSDNRTPLILWNHRHEHDKDPAAFHRVLRRLEESEVPFSLALLGERYRQVPEGIGRIRKDFPGKIVVDDYPDRKDYLAWLYKSDIVVSTAQHEFFGIAVIEAIAAGCRPLLPNRLSYPELIPDALRGNCLWNDEDELGDKLSSLCRELNTRDLSGYPSAEFTREFDWSRTAAAMDRALGDLQPG